MYLPVEQQYPPRQLSQHNAIRNRTSGERIRIRIVRQLQARRNDALEVRVYSTLAGVKLRAHFCCGPVVADLIVPEDSGAGSVFVERRDEVVVLCLLPKVARVPLE